MLSSMQIQSLLKTDADDVKYREGKRHKKRLYPKKQSTCFLAGIYLYICQPCFVTEH